MPKNEKNLTKIFLTKWIQMEQEEQDKSYTCKNITLQYIIKIIREKL